MAMAQVPLPTARETTDPSPEVGLADTPATTAAEALPSPTEAGADLPESLADLLQFAFDNNPTIQQARAGLEAARARIGHVGTLPNPQLKATLFLLPIETRVGPQRLAISATQNFPFPGTLSTKEAVAARAADVRAALLEAMVRDLLIEVRLAWYELHYLARALEIIRQNQAIALQIVEQGEAAFGKGDIPYFDYNRAQAELARLLYDEAALQDLLTTQWRTLNALLDRPEVPLPTIPKLASIRLETPLDDLPEIALENRHEITAAHHLEERADASLELAEKGFWPNFGVGVSWLVHEAEGTAPDRGQDALGLTVGFDIPIWRSSLAAKVDEAEARKREAGFKAKSEASRVRTMLADRVYDYVDSRRLLTLYDENLIPQAAAAMNSAEALSQGNFGTLLERKAIWLQFRLARERALANLYKATTRLEQAVGTPLEYAIITTAHPSTNSKFLPSGGGGIEGGGIIQPKPDPEQDPGHITHDDSWKSAKAIARKSGMKKALTTNLTRALLERAVLRRNPDVHRADEAVKETLQRFPQVAYVDSLVNQYRDLSAELTPAQGGMAPGPMNRERTTGEGTLSLKSAVAATEVRQAEVAAGLARRKAITEARLALADYRYAVKSRRVVAELVDLSRQLRDVAKQRVAAGSGKLTHVLQAEMLEAELETQRENLSDLAGQAKARMATLLDLPADFGFSRPEGKVKFSLPAQKELLRRDGKRQELRLMKLKIKRLGQVIALVQARAYPDLHTGQSDLTRPLAKDGKMAFPSKPMVREDIYSAGRQAYLDELISRRETLKDEKRRLTQEIRNQITQAHLQLKTALRNRNLHAGELPKKSREAMDLTLAAYRQGEATFTDLIVAQRDVIRHRLGALKAEREAEKALTRLQDAAVWRD